MQQCRALQGVIPVLITPLDGDGNIDNEGLIRLLDFLLEKEIGGLWVLGTGSEDMNLSFKKRIQVAEVVCEKVSGRIPVILGSGFFALEDILKFMGETKSLEFDAYHVMPYHPLLGLDRLEWFYSRIADNALKPLWMYTSGNWAPPVTPELVQKLKQHGNIAGIKFSSKDCLAMSKVLALAEENFQVITAVAAQFLACLQIGSRAHTSSIASALPDAMISIYQQFKAGDVKNAQESQKKLTGFLDAMPKTLKMDNFLGAAQEKYILSLRGICNGYTTSYYRDASASEKDIIREAIKKYDFFPGVAD